MLTAPWYEKNNLFSQNYGKTGIKYNVKIHVENKVKKRFKTDRMRANERAKKEEKQRI